MTASDPMVWLRRMPHPVQHMFSGKGYYDLLNGMQSYEAFSPITTAHAHYIPGQYSLALLRLSNAGMLQWSVVEEEEEHYRTLADSITMTTLPSSRMEKRTG